MSQTIYSKNTFERLLQKIESIFLLSINENLAFFHKMRFCMCTFQSWIVWSKALQVYSQLTKLQTHVKTNLKCVNVLAIIFTKLLNALSSTSFNLIELINYLF